MTTPYMPVVLATPIMSPSVGGSGAPPLAYLSNAQYIYAPTAVDVTSLAPKGSSNTVVDAAEVLADTIRQASRWVDSICFGAAPVSRGASLAASLSIESVRTRVKAGELRLLCDYKPIIQVVGIDIGPYPGAVSSIGPTLASMTEVRGHRTIVVPLSSGGVVFGRTTNDFPANIPWGRMNGSIYAVWSYVNGYPHTQLAAAVAQGNTSCVVEATDGNGGLWGVFPASGAFPGTELTFIDQSNTERVYVQAIARGTTTTTLTTTPFANAHALPPAPDFIPVTGMPEEVQRAVIFMTSTLIKTRGSKALVMPSVPGGKPNAKALAEAGALNDFNDCYKILSRGGYIVRSKSKV
jgi:hypothetical protein